MTERLIIFDLDGTLAESKAPLDDEMAGLLCDLLGKVKVAVISGASFSQFQSQFLSFLHCESAKLADLLILPTVGASLYRYDESAIMNRAAVENPWKIVYQKRLTAEETAMIHAAFDKALVIAASKGVDIPTKIYGERIEDRGSQVTFSALGQQAPVAEKALWDADHAKRDLIRGALMPLLPGFEVEIGGMTSIDITQKGINKKFGIESLSEELGLSKNDILYVGDALFPGGNDYGAVEAGVRTLAVKNVADTKSFIRGYVSK